MRKRICIFVILALLLGLSGCKEVGQFAGDVAQSAVERAERQLKEKLEQNRVELVEMKTAFGKLNDRGGSTQFFCGVLIRAENTDGLEVCRKVLSSVFEKTGVQPQTGQAFSSEYLVHKNITFAHGDFSSGDYYVVYGYMDSLLLGSAESAGAL